MKKNQILVFACSLMAALPCVILCCRESLSEESRSLLDMNIEALSLADENSEIEGISDCPGPALYSDVGIIDGRATLRFHINDSTDQLVTQTYKKCYASGSGKTRGNDMAVWDVYTESTGEARCLGELYHKSSLYED